MMYITKAKDFCYYFPYILHQNGYRLYIGEIDCDDKILISNGVNAYKHKVYLINKCLYFLFNNKRYYVVLYSSYNTTD